MKAYVADLQEYVIKKKSLKKAELHMYIESGSEYADSG